MRLIIDYTQLNALLAVERAGSFEGAGRLIGISAIGVSRRIAKLETRMGTRLLDRKPTRPTAAGEALCRYAENIEALEHQVLSEAVEQGLQDTKSFGRLKIAVGETIVSDSFGKVLDKYAARSPDGRLVRQIDIAVVNPEDAQEAMRTGGVVAAISSIRTPIHGFKSYRLGTLQYLAVASPYFAKHHFADGVTAAALNTASLLRLNNRDRHALDWIEKVTGQPATISPRCIPCPHSILNICMSGTAWAFIPKQQAQSHINTGDLIEIAPDRPLETVLFWHVANALDQDLFELTSAVRKAARSAYG